MTAEPSVDPVVDSHSLAEALTAALDGGAAAIWAENRANLGAVSADDPRSTLPMHEHRARTEQRLDRVAAQPGFLSGYLPTNGAPPDLIRAMVTFEQIGMVDPSLAVAMGVQFGLFGGAVLRLGTAKHHEKLFPILATAEGRGCFAMTEEDHGSNVQRLGTTATFDPATREFVLRTPRRSDAKAYIGNAAGTARWAVTFAQLVIDGRSRGVHGFLGPLRTSAGGPVPDIAITDTGEKGGLGGVANGGISYDQVRLPYDALLDHYAWVTADGVYGTSIESDSRRFFAMLGTLQSGRVAVTGAANGAAKTAITIGVRHGLTRRQFGDNDAGEELLLDKPLHQQRVLVQLARTYALSFAQRELVASLDHLLSGPPDADAQQVLEVQVASLKAYATDAAFDAIDGMRTACGGAGYLATNQLVGLRDDVDVYRTFEGDNNMLRLSVARGLLTGYRHLDPVETARFVVSGAWRDVVENTMVRHVAGLVSDLHHRPGGDAALRHKRHLEIFDAWERHVVHSLAQHYRSEIGRGAAPGGGRQPHRRARRRRGRRPRGEPGAAGDHHRHRPLFRRAGAGGPRDPSRRVRAVGATRPTRCPP